MMADENTVPKGNPEKSRGELTEGRQQPTSEVAPGDYAVSGEETPGGSHKNTKEAQTDDITDGDQAQARREKMSKMEKAEGDR